MKKQYSFIKKMPELADIRDRCPGFQVAENIGQLAKLACGSAERDYFDLKSSHTIRKAIFLDRDGTIIEDNGYLSDPSQVVFFDDTIDTLKLLQKEFLLFIVTNQQGIGEGILTTEDVNCVNRYVVDSLKNAGVNIKAAYVCPHTKADNCVCRKPNPYFLYKASKYYHIDLERSFVLGDHPSDIQLAINANANGIFVLTGHGKYHRSQLDINTVVVSGIGEAVKNIIHT